MALRDLHAPPTITAVLGPTNTGKTHRAIRRMLSHRTGMIGLPLRLLAREVYDKVSAEVGEDAVALVTGEEKRIPRKPRYWVCTTESMPIDRAVDFLAVDEVQLVEHRERGHVFTDRILRARGHRETWFLGADTMSVLLRQLAPTASFERNARLSRLRWGGSWSLATLPSRSAVIAFSASEVYDLAEQLRRRRGGAAVVLGALSPRTRNAQVAMYQSGEVPFLVATDAIGMGLNMDVDQVVFSSLRKFDGLVSRPLEVAELAQIAGRAGRWRKDGAFGVLEGTGEPDALAIDAVEQHLFRPVTHAQWRNAELDFSSVDALLTSLHRRPPARHLRAVPRAEDTTALRRLAQHPDVRARATSAERVALLWELCRLPDFHQTLTDSHTELQVALWRQLTGPRGRLEPHWIAANVAPLDQPEGDIETLMARLAFVRTWTTIAFHAAWLDDAEAWQGRTREIEDRLSDALHERLTRRFVDRRTLALTAGLTAGRPMEPVVAEGGVVEAVGHALGELRGLRFTPVHARDQAGLKAARATLGPLLTERVEALVSAPHEAISAEQDGSLSWQGGRLGRLVAGDDLLLPAVRLDDLPLVGAGGRARIHRRLIAWARDLVARLLGPLRDSGVEALSPPARGLFWALEQALGTLPIRAVREQLAGLTEADRRALPRLGVRVGGAFAYAPGLLSPAAVAVRALLWTTAARAGPLPLPAPGATSFPAEGDPAAYLAIGFPLTGPRAIRVDMRERVADRLRAAARQGPFDPPAELGGWLGAPSDELGAIVEALGWRHAPDGRFMGDEPRRRARRRPW